MSTMSTTAVTALTGRTMPTRYPEKACRYCAATPTAVAHLEGTTWYSVCAVCAVSYTAQAMGLLARAEALGEALTGEALHAFATAAQLMAAPIEEALAEGSDHACRNIVPGLLLLLAQHTPPPVRPNRYAKPCHRCSQMVAESEGRIELSAGAWLTYHLDGQCPEVAPATTTPATTTPATPLAATEAQRCIRNRRSGKCLSCGQKVPEGKGWAMQGLPDHRGWVVLHDDCADSLSADRHALTVLLPMLGDVVKAATGADTRDHAIRVAVDWAMGEGDGSQTVVFLRACWGAEPGVEVHTGAPGDVRRTPMGARRAVAVVRNLLGLTRPALLMAQQDYGRKMETCGRCGSPLTDDTSRAIGLGPDCAKAQSQGL